MFLHCLLFSLTRPRKARSCVSVLLPKNLPWGTKLLRGAQPRRTRSGAACKPEASCACRPLANGGAGVGQPNDEALPSCAVPRGVTDRWRYHFGVCWVRTIAVAQMCGQKLVCELPWSTCCRIRTTSPTSEQGELAPQMWELSHKGTLCSPSRFWRNHPRQTMPRDEERLGPRHFFGKTGAVQQAHVVRSVGVLAFGYCAVYAPRRELLQESMRKQFVGFFQTALVQEKHLPALHSVVGNAFRATSESTPELLFVQKLPPDADEALGHEPDFIATLGGQRVELVHSLLPFITIPDDEPSKYTWRPTALRVQFPFRVCDRAPFREAEAVIVPRLRR